MSRFSLKPTHKTVTAYYDSLAKFAKLGVKHESAVRSAFATLLEHAAGQFDWKLVPEWVIDQYRVTRDADGEIVSDPNRLNDEKYIVRLIGQVVHVSVETLKIIHKLPELKFP